MKKDRLQRHLVPCPHCGKEILDHMSACPFCKEAVTPRYAQPMDPEQVKKIRKWLSIIGVAVIAFLLLRRFVL